MNKKILIVEDEKPVANALKIKLSRVGFEITVVTNGQKALEILSKESFDLILLDLLMPEMDGFSVLESLKEDKTPVIVTSNLGQEEDVERAKDLGASGYIIKSNTPLTEIVSEVQKKLS